MNRLKIIAQLIVTHKPIAIALAAILIGGSVGVGVCITNNAHSNKVETNANRVNSTTTTPTNSTTTTPKKNDVVKIDNSIKIPATNSDVTAMNVIMYANTQVNVRTARDINSSVIVTLANNQAIQVIGKTSDGWYQVNWQGTVGYVKQEYLTEMQKAEQTLNVTNDNNSNSSSTSNGTNNNSNNSNGGASTSNDSGQSAQSSQQNYTAGIDSALTSGVNSTVCQNNNIYNGIKGDTIYDYATRIATGQIGQSQAISELNSMTWQESGTAMYGDSQNYDFNFYGTQVSIINISNTSVTTNDIASQKYGSYSLGNYQRSCVYRNSDGTVKVVIVSVGINYGKQN